MESQHLAMASAYRLEDSVEGDRSVGKVGKASGHLVPVAYSSRLEEEVRLAYRKGVACLGSPVMEVESPSVLRLVPTLDLLDHSLRMRR